MNRDEFYDALYLAHHGIKGQQWGKRNGPPYPLDEEDHSPKEQVQKKGLSDGAKRAIKIGAGIAAGALVAYGAYKLHQSGAFADIGRKKAKEIVDIGSSSPKGDANVSVLADKLKSSLKASPITESTEERLNNVNPLRGAARRNSCVQTAIANSLERLTGLGLVCKEDVDSSGLGTKHSLAEIASECFPEATTKFGDRR